MSKQPKRKPGSLAPQPSMRQLPIIRKDDHDEESDAIDDEYALDELLKEPTLPQPEEVVKKRAAINKPKKHK